MDPDIPFPFTGELLWGAAAIFLFAVAISFVGIFILERSLFKYRSKLSVERNLKDNQTGNV